MSKRQRKQTSRADARAVCHYGVRHWISIGVFACLFLSLVYKITLFDSEELAFLQEQAQKRNVRYQDVFHSRGDILDRNGKPLAISSRVFNAYVDPHYYVNSVDHANIISALTGVASQDIVDKVGKNKNRRYLIISKNLTPSAVDKIKKFNVSGLYYEEKFKRFYPASESVSQLIGYTDITGKGLEGIELAFNDWLSSKVDRRKVIVDGRGKVIRILDSIGYPITSKGSRDKNGRDLILSLDIRMQEIAYLSLQKHVRRARAKNGSIIMVDPDNGDILAVAGYPSFNPNNRNSLKYDHVRNRVFTDAVEPGSTIKPLTIMTALDSGRFKRETLVDTGDSRFFQLGKHRITDTHSYGVINVEQVIVKSSNIGAAKIGMKLGSNIMLTMFNKLSMAENTGSYFPGEGEGVLPYGQIHETKLATLSYGYGLKVTMAQLARAYSVIANGGRLVPLRLIRQKKLNLEERIVNTGITEQLREIMNLVTHKGGTGTRAAIKDYEVAGKTGTVHKFIGTSYSKHKYRSLFVGMAPAHAPRLVAVVMIDEPSENSYFGGEVAAPVFSEVVGKSLHLLHVAPDDRI